MKTPSSYPSTTLCKRLAEVAAKFDELEVALFTSFNCNSDFFEQNVLPALFGVDPDSSRAAARQAVHRHLAQTRVAVFCDASQIRPSRQSYRYATCPVFVDGRLFHPKNIILIGRISGIRWLYVAAMSANLSLSGWGKNCEGIADTWACAPGEDAIDATSGFLAWLEKHVLNGGHEGGLTLAKSLLEQMPQDHAWSDSSTGADTENATDPDGGTHEDRQQVRLYFSPQHLSMWDYVREKYGAIETVRATAPYWYSAGATAEVLKGVAWQLVAGRDPMSSGRFPLGRDVVDTLTATARENDGEQVSIAQWKDLNRRHHIKLYRIKTEAGTVTGTGSCNFTQRGLFYVPFGGGATKNEYGNVESMLFDLSDPSWPPVTDLIPEKLPPVGESDPAPQPLPFHVAVTYDWLHRRYEWRVEGKCSDEIVMHLPEMKPILLSGKSRHDTIAGDLKSRLFKLTWKGNTSDGVITELNLMHSDLQYGAPLPIGSILDSWRNELVIEPRSDNADGEHESDAAPDDGEPPTEQDEPYFDSFRFFQAMKAMRSKLASCAPNDHFILLSLLVSRADSVAALVNAVKDGSDTEVAKLVMYRECADLLRGFADIVQAQFLHDRVETLLTATKAQVLVRLSSELKERNLRDIEANAPARAEDVLAWYLKKLEGQPA